MMRKIAACFSAFAVSAANGELLTALVLGGGSLLIKTTEKKDDKKEESWTEEAGKVVKGMKKAYDISNQVADVLMKTEGGIDAENERVLTQLAGRDTEYDSPKDTISNNSFVPYYFKFWGRWHFNIKQCTEEQYRAAFGDLDESIYLRNAKRDLERALQGFHKLQSAQKLMLQYLAAQGSRREESKSKDSAYEVDLERIVDASIAGQERKTSPIDSTTFQHQQRQLIGEYFQLSANDPLQEDVEEILNKRAAMFAHMKKPTADMKNPTADGEEKNLTEKKDACYGGCFSFLVDKGRESSTDAQEAAGEAAGEAADEAVDEAADAVGQALEKGHEANEFFGKLKARLQEAGKPIKEWYISRDLELQGSL